MFKKKKITAKSPFSTGVQKGIAVLFITVILMCVLMVPVSAYETYYIDMPITQPTISDNLSYFEVSVRRESDGAVIGYTFLVSHKSMDIASDVPVSVSLYEDGTRHIIKIYNHTDYPITASYVDSLGNVKNFESALENGIAIEYRLPYPLVTIKSYGNIFVRDYKGFNTGSIVFQYGSTSKTNSLLNSILNTLNAQSGSTGSIVGAIEGSSEDIKQNQDENTQSIIDNQNQIIENEKNDANNTGNSGVNDLTNAVPDYSNSLIEAFTKLCKPMIHSETNCVLNTPQIKVPKINEFVPNDVVLLESQEIDLSNTMNEVIPQPIMLIVRSILTIVLFIFCYKEFYGLIEYIMTLGGKTK